MSERKQIEIDRSAVASVAAEISKSIGDVTPEEEEIIRKINRRMREAGISPYREIVNLGTGRRSRIVSAEDMLSPLIQPPGAGWHNDKWRCAECGGKIHDGACDKEAIRTWSERGAKAEGR